jgi:5-methylcytosine-specific restriction endonuclease McrA
VQKAPRRKSQHDELIGATTQLGFQNVIDAFHNVNNEEIPHRFFTDERGGTRKGIQLTDNLFRLHELETAQNLTPEVEARWRLVETAWELNISRRLIAVKHDIETKQFFVSDENRRVDVTSSRDSLNGYQKGKCFYCPRFISVVSGSPFLAHVDHCFPHMLKQYHANWNIDGVWNLVLACAECNGKKGAKRPVLKSLERLDQRNEYLISSNHPLKETIIRQTGKGVAERTLFLQSIFNDAKVLGEWEPPEGPDPTF